MHRTLTPLLPLCLLSGLLAACGSGSAPASAQGEASAWAFSPARDEFTADALLDLRSLNEKTAGESGFVRATPAGDFVLGSGRAARFWAVNTNVGRKKPFRPRPRWSQQEPDLDVPRPRPGEARREHGPPARPPQPGAVSVVSLTASH